MDDKATRIYPRIELTADSKYSIEAAQAIGVEPSDILKAQYKDIERELSIEELSAILDSTIKKDKSTKVIAFLNTLLTFTDRNQSNMALQGESSGGKTYLVQELLDYFDDKDVTFYGGASPTSFFHEQGVMVDKDSNEPIDFTQKPGMDATPEEKEAWAKRMRNSRILVDLEKKILVFLDQPHYKLLEYLRPLLSHDRKEIEYSITDKSEKMGLRTKKVRLRGFPTVFFCSTKSTMDDQEKTRMFLLSPETSPTKINETIDLLALKCCDTGKYEEARTNDARRGWLPTRVARIKTAGIRAIVIEAPKAIGDRFKKTHEHLVPRHQRDFPRLIGLIKGHALLNEYHRGRLGDKKDVIKASPADIDAGFTLYESIATPNELGLTPETWDIYEKVIMPWLEKGNLGLEKEDILNDYRRVFHRVLPSRKLADEILPTLEGAGLIVKEQHPQDRRKYIVYTLDIRDISQGNPPHPPDVRDISHKGEAHPTDAGDISQRTLEEDL